MNAAAALPNPQMQTLRELVPMAHVEDIERSIAFYAELGFKVSNADGQPGKRGWVWLTNGRAHLTLARTSRPMNPGAQDILFYMYASDVADYRNHLLARGIEAGPLKYPEYLRKGEFRIDDPDGYCLMVGQWEDSWFGY
jgi:catechol 2,3-dioxygenase-like lactoylglutathione lyase family enzyme